MVKHQRGDRAGLLRAAPRHPHAALARRAAIVHRIALAAAHGVASPTSADASRFGAAPFGRFLGRLFFFVFVFRVFSVAGGPRGEILHRFPIGLSSSSSDPPSMGATGPSASSPALYARVLSAFAVSSSSRLIPDDVGVVPSTARRYCAEQGSVVAAPATPHAGVLHTPSSRNPSAAVRHPVVIMPA